MRPSDIDVYFYRLKGLSEDVKLSISGKDVLHPYECHKITCY